MGLRNFFNNNKSFKKGGKFAKYSSIFEMVSSFLFTPKDVTIIAPHIRSSVDTKRLMTYVVLAAIPAMMFGTFNVGYQSLSVMGASSFSGWQGDFIRLIGLHSVQNGFLNVIIEFLMGLVYVLPIYLVTLVVGGIAEVVFSVIRGHEVTEGFLVTSMLYTLILPPTIPLWQVALGILFGVIIGKEIFGGQGKNFLNPALVGRAFLYFSYAGSISGSSIWIPVDGYSGATALSVIANHGIAALNITWWQAFWGGITGSIGETSIIAIALGLIFLLYTRIANYRLILGCIIGTVVTIFIINSVGSAQNPMFAMPWYWHIVVGGYAFGLVFMVTEPVSASVTNTGRWIYSFLIGAMVVLIRVLNPAYPEGMMLAILFGNIFAPLFDYIVMKNSARKLAKR